MAAGFPSTQCITDQVLSGHGVRRSSDASYYICGNDLATGEALFAMKVARQIHVHAESYLRRFIGRPANYEDLFYVVQQISDELYGEMDNPAILTFIGDIKTEISPLIEEAKEAGLGRIDSLETLIDETGKYIADIVWRRLCRKPARQSQLELIAHACKLGIVTCISTLCHDTHVESYLKENYIPISDGFAEPEADVLYWNGGLCSNGKTPFLKLHGSVDWFAFCPDDSSDGYGVRIGIPQNGYFYHTTTQDGELQFPIDGRPLLLIGTFNKIAQYSSGIFLDLYYHFRTTLREADQLVICGYGFGDKGINSELIDWYYDQRGRRVVVIHPDPDNLVAAARPAIRRIWDVWTENNSISTIEKRFEDVGIDEFSEAIGN